MGTTAVPVISPVSGASRHLTVGTSAAPASVKPVTRSEPEIDPATQQPVPLRFPWLSRLSQQLQAAARQAPPFAQAPVLGDHVDRKA